MRIIGRRKYILMASVLVCAVFSLALTAGCREAQMASPPELSNTPPMKVSGRQGFGFNNNIAFGPFKVTGIGRGWRETTAWAFFSPENYNSRQSSEFTVQSLGGLTLKANCATNVDQVVAERFLGSGSNPIRVSEVLAGRTNYVCGFKPLEGGPDWKLALGADAMRPLLAGVLSNGSQTIHVEGTNALEGSHIPLSEPTGYRFSLNGRAVGAVEVINDGRVWMSPDLGPEQQSALAAGAAALMIYRDLRRD